MAVRPYVEVSCDRCNKTDVRIFNVNMGPTSQIPQGYRFVSLAGVDIAILCKDCQIDLTNWVVSREDK